MGKSKPYQSSLAAGELSEDLYGRSDTEQYRSGAKSMRNWRTLLGGGAKVRPGTRLATPLLGPSRVEAFEIDAGTRYWLIFSDGRMDAVTVDLAYGGVLTGQPWDETTMLEMKMVQEGDRIFITHPTMGIYVITRTGATSWASAAFSFRQVAGDRRQPYYKIADYDNVLTVSAYSGSGVTLTLSASHWQSGHVGAWIRYHGAAIAITAVTSGTVATGTIMQQLPPSQDLTISDSSAFQVGQFVEGLSSGAKGVIRNIPNGTTLSVIITEGRTSFDTSGEDVQGPTGADTITAVTPLSPPLNTDDWDEQVVGDLWGYPTAITIHNNRLILGGHPLLGGALMGSKPGGDFEDFDVGEAGDDDGFFEVLGSAPAQRIVDLYSQEQLLVFSDKGPFYVPQTAANPFRPESIDFSKFGGNWQVTAELGEHDGGVIAVAGSLVYKLTPTGDQLKMWREDEASVFSWHLVKEPVDTAFSDPIGGRPERYGFFVNADGTMAVMMLMEAQQYRSFVPWTTHGSYRSVAASRGDVAFVVEREVAGATVYWLEVLDLDARLDATVDYANAAATSSYYADAEVTVLDGLFYLGEQTCDGSGGIEIEDTITFDGPYEVGISFHDLVRLETLTPVFEDSGGSSQGGLGRIVKATIMVVNSSRFTVGNYSVTAYDIGEDTNLEPPIRSRPEVFRFLGWRRQPTLTITQSEPGSLQIVGIQLVVLWNDGN